MTKLQHVLDALSATASDTDEKTRLEKALLAIAGGAPPENNARVIRNAARDLELWVDVPIYSGASERRPVRQAIEQLFQRHGKDAAARLLTNTAHLVVTPKPNS
jgi:hypothetical protein